MQTQDSNNKNFSCSKEPKFKDPKPVPLRDNAAEPLKKENRKDKKKRFWNQKQEYIRE